MALTLSIGKGGICYRRAFFALLVFCIHSFYSSSATADAMFNFDIPATDADIAIKNLSRQTGISTIFQSADVGGVQINSLEGRYTLSQALDVLFDGTLLSGDLTETGVITISRNDTSKIALSEEGEEIMNKKCGFFTALLGACVASVQPVLAQDTDSQANSSLRLEEVVVTARRVEENLQTVPMAVTNISGADLRARGAMDLRDVAIATPNVDIQGTSTISGFSSAPVIFIRGMGQEDFKVTDDPAVGIYLDGVYLARGVGSLLEISDVERAEVLRGPQGTLFGANSIGGAINLVSKKPTDEFSAEVNVTLGDYDRRDLEFVLNGPIAENLSGRLSILDRYREGYVKAVQYDDVWFGDDNVTAVRGQLRFTPSDTLTIDVSADYSHETERPGPQISVNVGDPGENWGGTNWSLDAAAYNQNIGNVDGLSTNPTLCGSVSKEEYLDAGSFPNDPACYGPYWASENHYETNDVVTDDQGNPLAANDIRNRFDAQGVSIVTDWDIGPGTLKATLAYRDFDARFYHDNDLTPMVVLANNTPEYDWDATSQELQYSTLFAEDRGHLTVGLYHYDESALQYTNVSRARALEWDCCGNAVQQDRSDGTFLFQGAPIWVDNESSAIYSQLSWDLTDRLHLTGGIRFTEETKDFRACQIWPGNNETTCNDGTQEASESTPMVSLGYDINEDTFVYGTYSEGYRSGGFPGRITFAVAELPTYDAEYAKTLEVGIKTDLFNDRMRFNLAAFSNKYTDMQLIGTPLGVSNDVIGSSQENLGDATINGVELETQLLVNQYLQLDISAGWMDAGFDCLVIVDDNYDRIGCDREQEISTGDANIDINSPLPRAPDFNINIGATLNIPLPNGASLSGRINWKDVSKFYYFHAPQPVEVNEGYSLLNASLTYSPKEAPWSVSVGGTNLGDEDYLTSMNQASAGTKAGVGRPRAIYSSFSYTF